MSVKTSILYFAIADLLQIIPNGNAASDYLPALDCVIDGEGNEIGVPSNDLSALNRIKNNYLSDNPYKWTKEQCLQRISQQYDYIGDIPSLQGRKFYQISVVASNIEQWIFLIKGLRDAREAATNQTFDWPEGQILNELDWSANFRHAE